MLRLSSATFLISLITAATAATGCSSDSTTDIAAITDPEGGNIIFEYIYLDSNLQKAFGLPAGVTTVQRTMAYFSNGMTPEDNALPEPGQCNNLDATKGWPLFIGSGEQDLDVGTLTIAGANKAGSDVTITVPQMMNAKDQIGRMHNTFYQVVNPVADNFLKPDSAYTVSFGGAGSVKATDFTDGLYLPGDFQVSDPPFENAPALVGGTDYTVHWTPGTSTLPTGPDYASHGGGVIGLTWLADVTGSPTHMCPANHSDGMFTITGSTINEYKQVAQARGTDPTHALLLRQAVVHILNRLPNGDSKNKRRVDMLAIVCWVQLVAVN
ncbi:MAG TPA: hypothetical protein VG871_23365 [Vicinamibacterales bacterium]|nr:hypothetical protein [Vicinamibacterales bacterium]